MISKAEISLNNKDLVYSTGNYTQYFLITNMRKEFEKEYIYVKQNHSATDLKLTQHCKLTMFQ